MATKTAAESFPHFFNSLVAVEKQEDRLTAARAAYKTASEAYFDAPLSDGSPEMGAMHEALRDAYRNAGHVLTAELECLVGMQRLAIASAKGELRAVQTDREIAAEAAAPVAPELAYQRRLDRKDSGRQFAADGGW